MDGGWGGGVQGAASWTIQTHTFSRAPVISGGKVSESKPDMLPWRESTIPSSPKFTARPQTEAVNTFKARRA